MPRKRIISLGGGKKEKKVLTDQTGEKKDQNKREKAHKGN